MTPTMAKPSSSARSSGPGRKGLSGGGLTPEVSFGKAYDARLVRRLGVFFRPHRGILFLAALSYPLVSVLQLFQPYLMKVALDRYIVPRQPEGFGWLIAGLVAITIAEFGGRFLQTILTQLLGQRVTRDLRMALFRKLQSVDLAYIERNPVGRLMTRVTNDVEALSETFSTGAISIVGDLVMLAGIVIMMTALDWKLSLYAFSTLPILLAFTLAMRSRARDAFRRVRTLLSQMNAFLNEAISGMSIIQTFNQQRTTFDDFEQINREYKDANFQAIRYDAITYAVVEAISLCAIALILLLGLHILDDGTVEVGLFVAFVEYLRRFFQPITELSTKYTVLQSAMASAERCVSLLDEEPTLIDPPTPVSCPPLVRAVEFQDVVFQYGPDEKMVLTGLSLSVGRGEKIAIVGPTGAGKSTIVKLLTRFYDPTSGSIRFDGVDTRQVPLRALRGRIAIVLQDPYLFDGTIRENIAFGVDDPTSARLEAAARRTCADAVIERTPKGWDAPVGERGSRLSAGERQLVAFARALALDPELLILDEATSSVDPETEALIQRGLDALIEDRTAIIIAHRLSTIRRADRIVVLSGGRVVEEGSHDQLLARGGIYRKLYELQFAEGDSADLASDVRAEDR
ncbi:MAG: ABC transporter ATP-binding protein [Deltaproteobacteria bacterium]|nr:ABC transporter ATP-binding protein [Deltaproteobacteria bacterium]